MVGTVAKQTFNITNQLMEKFSLQLGTSGKMPSWKYCLNHIKKIGFRPKTIFDVGIARGTEILYQAFPNAFYYLIDPSRESVPHMEEIQKQIRAKILNYALADRAGEVTLRACRTATISAVRRSCGDFRRDCTYKVKAERLDALVGDFEQPSLCKIDVRGRHARLTGYGRYSSQGDIFRC